ncbi:myo-inositol oxygenase [Oratosquilla oratoria]|uniref:myo-inositol oxygenase n=1 Tax=Oratosquilla oratoria TaxID=337810 RepID=UPI003F758810
MSASGHILSTQPMMEFNTDKVVKETGWTFRNFNEKSEDPWLKQVKMTYLQMHTHQGVDYVKSRREYWLKFDKFKATIMETLDKLNDLIDECDPDVNVPNIVHAFQTAERLRVSHPDKDWLHLTGLIHDLGKVMALYGEPQFSTVGDTYVVGCQFAPSIVYSESTFHDNPDLHNPKYNTKYGMYKPNCGLDNVLMSWGHDEYMYHVLKHNNCTLPDEGLFLIRYHSFYPWHNGGDYMHLCNDNDLRMIPWIKEFNKFDLYTKKEKTPDAEALKPYYQSLIDKYCPGLLEW